MIRFVSARAVCLLYSIQVVVVTGALVASPRQVLRQDRLQGLAMAVQVVPLVRAPQRLTPHPPVQVLLLLAHLPLPLAPLRHLRHVGRFRLLRTQAQLLWENQMMAIAGVFVVGHWCPEKPRSSAGSDHAHW